MNNTPNAEFRGWEYAKHGDYHRNLDPNWSYTATYLRKMAHTRRWIRHLPAHAKILDAGCGEGILVEEGRAQNRDIVGLDLNYESEFVQRGDVCEMPFADASFDAAIFHDTFEHLAFAVQRKALREIARVLKSDGKLIACIPNLAHLNSRFEFVRRGRLDRTDSELDHPGERPLWENRRLIEEAGFRVSRVVGITLPLPFWYHRVFCRAPARWKRAHDLLEPLAMRYPTLALGNLFYARKSK